MGSTSTVRLRCSSVVPRDAVDMEGPEFPRVIVNEEDRPPSTTVPPHVAEQLLKDISASSAPGEIRLDTLFPHYSR